MTTEIQLVKQSHEILYFHPDPERLIELAGRTCYKSEDRITQDSAKKFVGMILNRGHESVIEHTVATVKFITNRGVTHELVRHRIASYSQESTRYCSYKNKPIQFIIPVWSGLEEGVTPGGYYGDSKADAIFLAACMNSAADYLALLEEGWRPEQAREVLPNSLKTEIVMTANLREWRHVFKLRTSKAAHPQMRELMLPLLEEFKTLCPAIFGVL